MCSWRAPESITLSPPLRRNLVGPAIAAALDDPDDLPERDPDLDRYTGVYDSIWGQTAIVRWEDGLAALWLKSRDPKKALNKLEQIGEDTFVRIRDDDGEHGETIVFEAAADGTVQRFVQHSNRNEKVR